MSGPETEPDESQKPREGPERPAYESMVCPRCGAVGLEERHCNLVCRGCGYVESCEDIGLDPDPLLPPDDA